MIRKKKNPNNHRRETPRTVNRNDDKAFTSYDTAKDQTSTPQKVREGEETPAKHAREKRAKHE